MTIDDEWDSAFKEYREKLHTGYDLCCPIPDGEDGIKAMRECIKTGKTYPELIGFKREDGVLY
ncbi:MAG: hypothetical protein SOI24_10940 [Coriobacteriales bacterium]|jgi:hypothetical protein